VARDYFSVNGKILRIKMAQIDENFKARSIRERILAGNFKSAPSMVSRYWCGFDL
jgi:hypothetical protein